MGPYGKIRSGRETEYEHFAAAEGDDSGIFDDSAQKLAMRSRKMRQYYLPSAQKTPNTDPRRADDLSAFCIRQTDLDFQLICQPPTDALLFPHTCSPAVHEWSDNCIPLLLFSTYRRIAM